MKVFHGRTEGGLSEQRGATFTGTVWADPIMPSTNNVSINNVFFHPAAAPIGIPTNLAKS